MSISFRLAATALLLSMLSACASALPNGAAPVSSLYSYTDTARFMLGDICLPSVVEDIPVEQKADVPAVYPNEGAMPPSWRAGPGGAVKVTRTGARSCTVTSTRGIPEDLRAALMREAETSRSNFRLVDSVRQGGMVTDTYCAPFPSGLSIVIRTRTGGTDNSDVIVSAEAGIRRDLCV